MKLSPQRLRAALAVCGLSATLALALPPPYAFTGQWSGTATSRGVSAPLSVNFSPTSDPRQFTGTATLESPGKPIGCTFTATYKKKLKLKLTCDNGSHPTVTARLNTTTQMLTGSFPIRGGHGKRHIARFALTKAAG